MSQASISEFADKLNQIIPVIAQEFTKRQSNELFRGKITLPQFLILNILEKEGECRMTDIAGFLDVSTAAATGLVDRLVKYVYVERVFDPNDRRIIRIRLTRKGEVLVKKITLERRQMIMDIFGKISEKERGDYLRILTKIQEILNKKP